MLPSVLVALHVISEIDSSEVLHDQANVSLVFVAADQSNDVRVMNLEQVDNFVLDVAFLSFVALVVSIIDFNGYFISSSFMNCDPNL